MEGEMSEWISTSERMPSTSGLVLALRPGVLAPEIVSWHWQTEIWVESVREWEFAHPRETYNRWAYIDLPKPPEKKCEGRFFTMWWMCHPENGYVIVDRYVYNLPFPTLGLSKSQAEGIAEWLNERLDKTR